MSVAEYADGAEIIEVIEPGPRGPQGVPANTDSLQAAIDALETTLAAKQDASTAATDAELSAAVSALITAIAAKQDASTAATDAELAAEASARATAVSGEATARAAADAAHAVLLRADNVHGIDTELDAIESTLSGKASASALTTETSRATAAEAAAQATADAALPKAGGTMTGNIVLAGDPSANLHPATRQYVLAQIAALINSAPSALDTLKEIADQLSTDESAVTALTATVAGKLAAANNLSDLVDAVAARTNLGLGTAATQPTGAFDAAGAAAAAQAAAEAASDPVGSAAAVASDLETETSRAEGVEDGLDTRLIVVEDRPVLLTPGLLAAIPDPATVPAGSEYFATDDHGGSTYKQVGGAWVVTGAKVEMAFVAYTAVDDSARGNTAFHVVYGPTDATAPVPANSPFQASWVSRGRPIMVEALLVFLKDTGAATYVWSRINLLGGSATGYTGMSDMKNAVSSGYLTARPQGHFADAAGISRTVSADVITQAGNVTLKGATQPAILRAWEV